MVTGLATALEHLLYKKTLLIETPNIWFDEEGEIGRVMVEQCDANIPKAARNGDLLYFLPASKDVERADIVR